MGHMYIIIVGSHSKWLDVQIIQSISTSKTVEKLRFVFATHGLPRIIVSDNGPSFTSDEFKKFMQANGIRHITSAPYHPSTNGLAERAVQTVKQDLKQINGNSVEEKFFKVFLEVLNYSTHYHRNSTIRVSDRSLIEIKIGFAAS